VISDYHDPRATSREGRGNRERHNNCFSY